MTLSDPHESRENVAATHFSELGDVVRDEHFPAVDLSLRRGRHIHRDDTDWYAFLLEAQVLLEEFYRRYGCELVHRSDGYFFLLPVSDSLGKRHLSVAEMIVGQGLALAYLDPGTVQNGGVVTREELLGQLATVMGTDALMRALNPKRKKPDERLMQRTVRQKVVEALRRLSQLGFVELLEGDRLRLPPSLLRFAEPVRGLEAPSEALAQMLQRGEVQLGPGDADGEDTLDGEELLDGDELDQDAVDTNAAPPTWVEDSHADAVPADPKHTATTDAVQSPNPAANLDARAEAAADAEFDGDADDCDTADGNDADDSDAPDGKDADDSDTADAMTDASDPPDGNGTEVDEPLYTEHLAQAAESFDDFMTFDNELAAAPPEEAVMREPGDDDEPLSDRGDDA